MELTKVYFLHLGIEIELISMYFPLIIGTMLFVQ